MNAASSLLAKRLMSEPSTSNESSLGFTLELEDFEQPKTNMNVVSTQLVQDCAVQKQRADESTRAENSNDDVEQKVCEVFRGCNNISIHNLVINYK